MIGQCGLVLEEALFTPCSSERDTFRVLHGEVMSNQNRESAM